MIIEALLLTARVTLAAVFAVAAVGKLADQDGSRKAMVAFGVPSARAPAAGLTLPLAELAVAIALVPAATAWYGAIGALCLLALFTGGIAWALARGRKPDCHCFGQIHSAPAGPLTLLRNAGLAGVATFAVVTGQDDAGYSVLAWTGDLSAAQALAIAVGAIGTIVLGLQSWFLWQVLRQSGNLLLRIEALERTAGIVGDMSAAGTAASPGLPVGSAAPEFRLANLNGEQVSLASLLAAGRPLLLVFSDPDCGPCNSLMPEVSRWQIIHEAAFTIVVVGGGPVEANRAKAAEHGIATMLIQPDRSVSEAFGCTGTPCAVLISPDGTIASAPAGGPGPIRTLVERVADASLDLTVPVVQPGRSGNGHAHVQHLRGLPLGEAAPALKLTDLDGQEIELDRFRGAGVAVLFWNPGCGYCRRILPEVKAWESEQRGGLTALFVSRGPADENRAMGLRSTIVLDDAFAAGRSFGASGTPSAVLIDKNGMIASGLAAGAPSVLALIRSAGT